MDSDGAEVFLLGNQNADSLSVFHLQTGRSQRKKIGGCCGIFQTEPDTFFIFNYDCIAGNPFFIFIRNGQITSMQFQYSLVQKGIYVFFVAIDAPSAV